MSRAPRPEVPEFETVLRGLPGGRDLQKVSREERDVFVRQNQRELAQFGISTREQLENKLNQSQKGFFKKSLSAVGSVIAWPFKTVGSFVKKHPVLTATVLAIIGAYFGLRFARNRYDVASSRGFEGVLDTTGAGRLFGRPDGFTAPTLSPGSGPLGPARPGLPGAMPHLPSEEIFPRP